MLKFSLFLVLIIQIIRTQKFKYWYCQNVCDSQSYSYDIYNDCDCDTLIQEKTKIKLSQEEQYTPVSNEQNGLQGYGFSIDAQQIRPNLCFDIKQTTVEQWDSFQRLNFEQSYEELQHHITKTKTTGFLFWKKKKTYFEDIEEKEYRTSLNFFSINSRHIKVQLQGYQYEALTPYGKNVYNNDYESFGIICGDEYINRYQEGALLIMSLVVNFKEIHQKGNFQSDYGKKVGNIIDSLKKINQIKDLGNGNYEQLEMEMKVFQQGGDIDQLSSKLGLIFDQDNIARLKCTVNDSDPCKYAAERLMDYATLDFPNQLKKGNYMPIESSVQSQPIEYIGLKRPRSLVTTETMAERIYLKMEIDRQKYFRQKMYPVVFNMNRTELDLGIQNQIDSTWAKIKGNIEIIERHNEKFDNAIDGCQNMPRKCSIISGQIRSQIQEIKRSDFGFMDQLPQEQALFIFELDSKYFEKSFDDEKYAQELAFYILYDKDEDQEIQEEIKDDI